MNKNIRNNVLKKVIILTSICMLLMSVFSGCYNNISPTPSIDTDQERTVNYIMENLDTYKSRIKEETGFEGKIVSEEVDSKEQKYIEFDVDDITKIKFEINDVGILIIKPVKDADVEILLIGTEEDNTVSVKAAPKVGGRIACEYKANDLENSQPRARGDESHVNSEIKRYIETEELQKLVSKAHSIYNTFEKIYKENNPKK